MNYLNTSTTETPRQRSARREASRFMICTTREAYLFEIEAQANRRGYGDAYELGVVGSARRGWNG